MYCPNCGAPMVSAARVYNRNVVTEETFYCPRCRARRVRHRSARKGIIAGLLILGLLGGPCSRDYSLFRIGMGQPVIQNPDVDKA